MARCKCEQWVALRCAHDEGIKAINGRRLQELLKVHPESRRDQLEAWLRSAWLSWVRLKTKRYRCQLKHKTLEKLGGTKGDRFNKKLCAHMREPHDTRCTDDEEFEVDGLDSSQYEAEPEEECDDEEDNDVDEDYVEDEESSPNARSKEQPTAHTTSERNQISPAAHPSTPARPRPRGSVRESPPSRSRMSQIPPPPRKAKRRRISSEIPYEPSRDYRDSVPVEAEGHGGHHVRVPVVSRGRLRSINVQVDGSIIFSFGD